MNYPLVAPLHTVLTEWTEPLHLSGRALNRHGDGEALAGTASAATPINHTQSSRVKCSGQWVKCRVSDSSIQSRESSKESVIQVFIPKSQTESQWVKHSVQRVKRESVSQVFSPKNQVQNQWFNYSVHRVSDSSIKSEESSAESVIQLFSPNCQVQSQWFKYSVQRVKYRVKVTVASWWEFALTAIWSEISSVPRDIWRLPAEISNYDNNIVSVLSLFVLKNRVL